MLTKLLCKWFNLIKRNDIETQLSKQLYLMSLSKNVLKKKYDNKNISEWTYYKKLWMLRGRLQMLEDIVNTLK